MPVLSAATRPPGEATRAVLLAQELVRIDTTSTTTGQRAAFSLVAHLLAASGYDVQVDSAASASGYPLHLTAAPPTAANEPLLLFACHVDTVPTGDPHLWGRPPLSGELGGGRLHGRGASDMKAGLGAALAVLAAHPDRNSALLLTADEEIGCLGAAAAGEKLSRLPVAAVVVPEPTDNRVLLGHRGALWLQLTARGTAAHGSTPSLGRNALLDLARALPDVEARLPRATDAVLGATTVNVATMAAGTAPNVVPDHAQAQIDVRYVHPEERQAILGWLKEQHPRLDVTVITDIPPVRTDPGDPWVRSLPVPAEQAAAPYFTDAALLGLLFPAVPVVIWGPGHVDQAHVRDEYATVDNIHRAAAWYGDTTRAWSPRQRRATPPPQQ